MEVVKSLEQVKSNSSEPKVEKNTIEEEEGEGN